MIDLRWTLASAAILSIPGAALYSATRKACRVRQAFAIYCSVLLAIGFVLFFEFTANITLLAIIVVAPGLIAAGLLVAFFGDTVMRFAPVANEFVFVINILLYSALAFNPVQGIAAKRQLKDCAVLRTAAMLTVVIAVVVFGGWLGAKTLARYGIDFVGNLNSEQH